MRTTANRTNAGHTALACAVLMVGFICGSHPAAAAEARPTYDLRIEEAAIRKLQPKLGTMRGALELTARNHLFPPLRQRLVDSGKVQWPMPAAPDGRSDSIIRY